MTLPIASKTVGVSYAARTDRGRQREVNEDFVFADDLVVSGHGASRAWTLLVVADGVGGHQRGEWASKTAVGVLRDQLPGLLKTMEPGAALKAACEEANTRTWREALDLGLEGSATTLVATLINGDEMWLANVGDSRAYLLNGATISQLTTDHSFVEEQVQSGRMTPEEARTSSQRNIITRSIGFGETVEVDVSGPMRLNAGDKLLLCSDGLYDQLSDNEMATAVDAIEPDDAARRLVELANERGGSDNVSVIVCSIERASSAAPASFARPPRRRRALRLLLLVLISVGVAAAAAALFLTFGL